MLYVKNLPMWERVLRVLAGAAIAAYGWTFLSGIVAWLVLATGIGTAVSGLLGFCPACAMVGRRLPTKHTH